MSSDSDENAFAGLMDDSYDYYSDDEFVAPAAPPPPPPPVAAPEPKKKNAKNSDDEDEEYLQLMKELEGKTQKSKPKQSAQKRERPHFNVAKELVDKYCDISFEDCTKLAKTANNTKFMTRRRDWPVTILSSFRVRDLPGDHYEVSLTEYGLETKKKFGRIQAEPEQASALFQMLKYEKFCIQLLAIGLQFAMYNREFADATEYALRLSWIIQQSIPTKFVFGKSMFVGDVADLEEVCSLVATFSFRRGCYVTSSSLWGFVLESFNEDYVNAILCAAVPALYAGNKDLIDDILHSDRKYENIPVDMLPDWRVCSALINDDDEVLKKEMGIWKHAFFGEDIPEGCNEKLASLEMALHKRLDPYLQQPEVEKRIRRLKKDVVPGDRTPFENAWAGFEKELPLYKIIEEAAMYVGN